MLVTESDRQVTRLSDPSYISRHLEATYIEYKFLRDEILTTTTQIYNILSFGSTIVAASLGFAFNFWDKQNVLVKMILGILAPTLAFVFTEILLGQIVRIRRAGKYCRTLELKIKSFIVGDKREVSNRYDYPIGWENWLESISGKRTLHTRWLYLFGIMLFILISWFSILTYIFYSYDAHEYIKSYIFRLVLILPVEIELLKTWLYYRQVIFIVEERDVPILMDE